jgi:hypothetical protein
MRKLGSMRVTRQIDSAHGRCSWWQEEAIAGPELFFRSAIADDVDLDRVREPWWYAVRFNHTRVRVLEGILAIVGLD